MGEAPIRRRTQGRPVALPNDLPTSCGRRRRPAASSALSDGAIGTSVPRSEECVVDGSGELALKRVRSSDALNHSAIRRARQSSRPYDAASPRRLPSRKRRQALDTLPYDPAHDGLPGLTSLLMIRRRAWLLNADQRLIIVPPARSQHHRLPALRAPRARHSRALRIQQDTLCPAERYGARFEPWRRSEILPQSDQRSSMSCAPAGPVGKLMKSGLKLSSIFIPSGPTWMSQVPNWTLPSSDDRIEFVT